MLQVTHFAFVVFKQYMSQSKLTAHHILFDYVVDSSLTKLMQKQDGSKKDNLIVATSDDDQEGILANDPPPYQTDILHHELDSSCGYTTEKTIRVRMYWGLLKNFVLLIDGGFQTMFHSLTILSNHVRRAV